MTALPGLTNPPPPPRPPRPVTAVESTMVDMDYKPETLKYEESMHLKMIETVMREFSKMASCQIKAEKSIFFLYVGNKNHFIIPLWPLGNVLEMFILL